MAVDASIPLGFAPTPGIGPDPGKLLSMQDLMLQMQQRKQAGEEQNMLKKWFEQPGTFGADGQPTQQSMMQLGAISPKAFMSMQGAVADSKANALRQQEIADRRNKVLNDLGAENVDRAHGAMEGAMKVYLQARESGMGEAEARDAAQNSWSPEYEAIMKGGNVPASYRGAIPQQFDPQRFGQMGTAVADWKKEKSKAAADQRANELESAKLEFMKVQESHLEKSDATRAAKETADEKKAENDFTLFAEPAGKDAPGRTLRVYKSGKITDLQGNPVTDAKSVEKLGTEKKATAADNWTESDKDFWANVLKGGGTLPPYAARGSTGQALTMELMHRIPKLTDAGSYVEGKAGVKADTASLTQLQKSTDAITAFENTAIRNGDKLVELAKKVDSTGVPVAERWLRAGKKGIKGDTDVSDFDTQYRAYVPETAKILTNPNLTGQLTDAARHEIEDAIPKWSSAEQVESSVGILKGDFAARKKYLLQQIDTAKDRLRHEGDRPKEGAGAGGEGSDGGEKAKHAVGDVVVQGGKHYRATKVDDKGRVLQAEEVKE